MIAVAARSDIGCKRTNNEDSFGYDLATGIFAVSDGMGGSAAGEIASHIAMTTTLAHFRTMLADDRFRGQPMQHRLYYAVTQANAAVYQQALQHPEYAGMGATLVALCIAGTHAVIANVGDSRAYLLRGGSLSAITRDHSLGAEQMAGGHPISPSDPSFNIITRAIGVAPAVEPDLFGAELQADDLLLLASDGLMKHLEDEAISRIIRGAPTLDIATERLIDAVKAQGGTDNVTCVLVHITAAAA